MKFDPPRNKKEVQSFVGRINFWRRFIPNLTKILRAITNMLRKDNEIKWNAEVKRSFSEVKEALPCAPVLISPNYTKDFIIFSFASEHTIAAVLS